MTHTTCTLPTLVTLLLLFLLLEGLLPYVYNLLLFSSFFPSQLKHAFSDAFLTIITQLELIIASLYTTSTDCSAIYHIVQIVDDEFFESKFHVFLMLVRPSFSTLRRHLVSV